MSVSRTDNRVNETGGDCTNKFPAIKLQNPRLPSRPTYMLLLIVFDRSYVSIGLNPNKFTRKGD